MKKSKMSIVIPKELIRYKPRLILKAPKIEPDRTKYNRKRKYGRKEE